MKNHVFPIALALAGCLTVVSGVRAQDFDTVLAPEQAAELNAEAGELYNAALLDIDRINTAGALTNLAAAAAADPNHIEIQFLLARYARSRAEYSYGEESLRYYDMAETALRRLLANPALGPEERTRVRRESERVRQGKESLRARDQKRLEDGFDLVLEIRQQRLEASGLAEKLASVQGIDDILREAEATEDGGLKAEDIWQALLAPGLALDRPQAQVNQFGGFNPYANPYGTGALDPFATGGVAPGTPGGFDASGNPFAAQPGAPIGGDPFAPQGGAPPPATDPFADFK